MKIIHDYQGMPIRLTDERLEHILGHPEMVSMEADIQTALATPQQVVESISDAAVRLYYRYYVKTMVGSKYLCIVVKMLPDDAFVITAYLTDRIKKGNILWPPRP